MGRFSDHGTGIPNGTGKCLVRARANCLSILGYLFSLARAFAPSKPQALVPVPFAVTLKGTGKFRWQTLASLLSVLGYLSRLKYLSPPIF